MKTLALILLTLAAAAATIASATSPSGKEVGDTCNAFFTVIARALPGDKRTRTIDHDRSRESARTVFNFILRDQAAAAKRISSFGEKLALTDHGDGFKIRYSVTGKEAESEKPSAEELLTLRNEVQKLLRAIQERARKTSQVDQRVPVFHLDDPEDIDRALNVVGRRLEKIDPEDSDTCQISCTIFSGALGTLGGLGVSIGDRFNEEREIGERNEFMTQRNQDKVWESVNKDAVWDRESHLRLLKEKLHYRFPQDEVDLELAYHSHYLTMRETLNLPIPYGSSTRDYAFAKADATAMTDLAMPYYPVTKQTLQRLAERYRSSSEYVPREPFTREALEQYNAADPQVKFDRDAGVARGFSLVIPGTLAGVAAGRWYCSGKLQTFTTKVKRIPQRMGSQATRSPQHPDVETIRELIKAAKASPPKRANGDDTAVHWLSATSRSGRSSHLILEIEPLPTRSGKKEQPKIRLSGFEYRSGAPFYKPETKKVKAKKPTPEAWRKMEDHFIAEIFPTAKPKDLVGIEHLFDRAKSLDLKGQKLAKFEASLRKVKSLEDLGAPQALLQRFELRQQKEETSDP